MSLTLRTIAESVAAFYEVSYADMITHRRDTVAARHVAFWLARHMTDKTLPQIGRAYGRDHSTIAYGINQIERARQTDPQLAGTLAQIEQALRALSGALDALKLAEKPESDPRTIAERVLATHSGPMAVSVEEIRQLAIAVVTMDAQMNGEAFEPKPEPADPEAEPAPSFPVMVAAPPLYEPQLAAFAAAHKQLENAEHGRGERWAREQFEKAAAALAKAYRPTLAAPERKAS